MSTPPKPRTIRFLDFLANTLMTLIAIGLVLAFLDGSFGCSFPIFRLPA